MTRNAYLPPDMIEAILWRLPAKSLCRFKSVSKSWFSLISDPQFIKNQLNLNNHHTANKLILVSDTGCLYSVDINEIRDNSSGTGDEVIVRPSSIRWDQIVGSCNGLVLALDQHKTLYLVNPTTREVLELPFGSFQLPINQILNDMWGFGYDSSIDNYKIIRIRLRNNNMDYCRGYTNMLVSVFNLKNNSKRRLWRCSPPYDILFSIPFNGIFINGNIHWLIYTRPTYCSTIVAFNLANEKFTEIEFPKSCDNKDGVFNQIFGIGGKLGLLSNLKDLWVMEEYGVCKSWTKISIHGVETRPICSVDGSIPDIVFGYNNKVGIYNVHERVFRDVRILGCFGFNIGGAYIESLVSPRCIRRTV